MKVGEVFQNLFSFSPHLCNKEMNKNETIMKKLVLLAIIALGAVSLQSCDNDDDNLKVSPTLQGAFESHFPNIGYVEWERQGSLYEADFFDDGLECTAWFTENGTWLMTEYDARFNDLPKVVQDAFQISEYASWHIDDVDIIEQKDMATKYVIEVENRDMDLVLVYFEDGTLISDNQSQNENGSHMPVMPDQVSDIRTMIQQQYPNAQILDVEYNKTHIEVEIRDENRLKEVIYVYNNGSYTWTMTSYDIFAYEMNSLPQAVLQTIENNKNGGHVDDVDFCETPEGNYYLVEIEVLSNDYILRIDEQGNVL